jgi:hypothetical protein
MGPDCFSSPPQGKTGVRAMVDEMLKPALRVALRLHEIGDLSPYQLGFAGKGKSGASFGFMQADLAAGQPECSGRSMTRSLRPALPSRRLTTSRGNSPSR